MTPPRVLVVQFWQDEETSDVLGVFVDEAQARQAIADRHAAMMRHAIKARWWGTNGVPPPVKIEETHEADGFWLSHRPGWDYFVRWCEVGVPIPPQHD